MTTIAARKWPLPHRPPATMLAPPTGYEWHPNRYGSGVIHAIPVGDPDPPSWHRQSLCRLWWVMVEDWAWPAPWPAAPADQICRLCRRKGRPVAYAEGAGGKIVGRIGSRLVAAGEEHN